jgi:membrane-associated phospholipid phosphatase
MADDFLAPYSSPLFAVSMLALMQATLIFFLLAPGVDIAVSRAFFDLLDCPAGAIDMAACGHFATGADPAMKVFRQILQILPAIAAVVVLVWAGYRHFRRRDFGREAIAEIGVVFGALILSPLIIVNGILKEFWGRPRPHMVDFFGGTMPFVPAGRISDYCQTNCSFVSGEAAGAFWLVCLVPLVPKEDRMVAFMALFTIAAAASLLRVAFGGHFLSDVMLGGMMTVTVFSLLAMLARFWLMQGERA